MVAARTGVGVCAPALRLLGVGMACMVVLALGATAARAELTFSTTFGSQGTGDGQLSAPQGIGVDQTTLDPTSGDVYVADTGNARVEQFNSAGQFLGAWGWGVADGKESLEVCTSGCRAGIPGSGAGQFSAPTSIAVDSESGPSQGDVYVGDSANKVVDEFGPSGSLLGTITGPSAGSTFQAVTGVAVDGEGNLWVLDGAVGVVYEFGSGGALLEQFDDNNGETKAIAVDSAGDLYLINGGGQTEKWTAAARAGGAAVTVDDNQGFGLGVDQATNDLYVDLGASIDQWGPSDESLGNFGSGVLGHGEQLAYNPNVTLAGAGAPGALYVVDESDNWVAVFTPPPPASPTVLPDSETATAVTPDTATLEASINANGLDTAYFFEYGPTTGYGTQIPLPPGTDIGSNYGAIAAKTALSGLAASTVYHFRVVAANSLGTTYGPDATLTTPPPATIEAQSAANVTATAADLTAKIDTEDLATSYQFEYGTIPSYGMQAPLPAATLAAASGTQSIAVHVEDLQPNTTYYFRVVATNVSGTLAASATKFTTYPPSEAFSLPDNRVYELVSPPDKNGGDVGGGEGFLKPPASAYGQSSVSGSAITYASAASFGDAQSAQLSTQYLSTRGPSGWTTHAISPPATPTQIELRLEPFDFFTPELTAWVFAWKNPSLTQDAPPKIENLYLGEAGADAYQLIDGGTPANPGESYEVVAVGASSDLRHVVFEADEALTPGAPAGGAWSLYEWTPGAPLRLVSVLPGPGEVAASSGRDPGSQINRPPNLVSSDGSRIFWIDGGEQLYVREDGASTVQLNASQRTPSLGDGTARFVAATPDGSRAFFIDETALTNATGDNGGLYEYSFAGDRLTDLTPDAGGSPGTEGVLGTSEDGASIYFVASASLPSKAVPGAGQPSAGGHNLYLARDGALTFIATLSSEDSDDWTESFNERTAEVAPDGGNLAFVSKAPLTGYVNTDLNTGEPDAEVFLYDAGAEALRCVSCNPSGERPIGPASVPTARGTEHLPRYLAEDGQRLFFDSKDALLPAASNGKQNVYEYENGAIYLISAGTSNEDSTLVDTSANGDNVFFTTRSQLVPGDQDENSDMYDARVDGGFPATISPEPCSGEGCRGPVSAPPAPATIVTEEMHGTETLPAQPADPAVSKRKAKKPKHKSKKPTHKAGARHSARKARRSHATRGGRRVGRERKAARHSPRRTAGHSSRVSDSAAGGER